MQALWGQCLEQLRDRGLTPDQIAATLPRMQVELVLTAHPTEAKRTIVLEHHRSLYLLLVKRENQVWTPNEQRAIRDEFKTLLSLLWRTGEIFLHKPDVAAERRNVMHYLYSVFPDVLPALDGRLRQSWAHLGFDPRSAARAGAAAAVPSGHVGRRRSGRASARHGGCDARDARRSAPARVAAAAASARRARPAGEPVGSPRAAASGVEQPRRSSCMRRIAARAAATIVHQEHGETWRQLCRPDAGAAAARERLPGGRTPASGAGGYQRAAELIADLRLLYDSLVAVGAWRVADAAVAPVIRRGADVRIPPGVARRPPEQRASTISRSRSCSRPPDSSRPIFRAGPKSAASSSSTASSRRRGRFCASDVSAGPEADAVLGTFRVLADHLREYGPDGAGRAHRQHDARARPICSACTCSRAKSA